MGTFINALNKVSADPGNRESPRFCSMDFKLLKIISLPSKITNNIITKIIFYILNVAINIINGTIVIASRYNRILPSTKYVLVMVSDSVNLC